MICHSVIFEDEVTKLLTEVTAEVAKQSFNTTGQLEQESQFFHTSLLSLDHAS